MTPQKEWSLKTVLEQFSRKTQSAFNENILDRNSPVRDEELGTVIDMLIEADFGMTVELPGQIVMAVGGDEDE